MAPSWVPEKNCKVLNCLRTDLSLVVLLAKCITQVFCNAWKPVGLDGEAASSASGPPLGKAFLAWVR